MTRLRGLEIGAPRCTPQTLYWVQRTVFGISPQYRLTKYGVVVLYWQANNFSSNESRFSRAGVLILVPEIVSIVRCSYSGDNRGYQRSSMWLHADSRDFIFGQIGTLCSSLTKNLSV